MVSYEAPIILTCMQKTTFCIVLYSERPCQAAKQPGQARGVHASQITFYFTAYWLVFVEKAASVILCL